MAIRNLIPRRHGDGGAALPPARRWESEPFLDLWHDMERVIGLGGIESRAFAPVLDVRETSDQVQVSAELPGLNKEDVEISIEGNNVLILSGEKKSEEEKKEGGYYRSERYYGAFTRRVLLPADVDFDKAEANFKNGVLTVLLPKTEEAKRKHRKIEIKGE